jgi:hypothetical protein
MNQIWRNVVVCKDSISADAVGVPRLTCAGCSADMYCLRICPTQEFFDKSGREFWAKCFGLWRQSSTDENNPSMFAPHGLFLTPSARPSQFVMLGLLFGKVLLMDMFVSLPLSSAFFGDNSSCSCSSSS